MNAYSNALALLLMAFALCLSACEMNPGDGAKTLTSCASGLSTTLQRRQITIHAGCIKLPGKTTMRIRETNFNIPDCPEIIYTDEPFDLVKGDKNDPDASLWQRTPQGIKVCGLPVPSVLCPESLCVKTRPGNPEASSSFAKNYIFDPKWGIILANENALAEVQHVFIDYAVRQRRIYTVAATATGELQLVAGEPCTGTPSPPELSQDCIAILNVLAPPDRQFLKESDVMPITNYDPSAAGILDTPRPVHTIALLKKHKPVKICFIGDSVTCGCCAKTARVAFPSLLAAKLRSHFQDNQITCSFFCNGGCNSSQEFDRYLKRAHSGNDLPDLLVVEFVNDLPLGSDTLVQNYRKFASAMRAQGTEVIICLPHLVNPTYLGFQSNDWRAVASEPYYTIIRQLSRECNFAVADVAHRSRYCNIEGLRPELLLADGINHPNGKGHSIYAEEIMKCFQ